MRCDDCKEMLNAYIDGELMPEEATSVKDHLATCEACSNAHKSLVHTSRLLQEGLVRYPAPDVLKARIHNALTQSVPQTVDSPTRKVSSGRWAWLAAAGIIVAVASSGVTYSTLQRSTATRSVADEVLSSHVRSLMPGHLTDVASTNQHNVKPWFNGRVNLSPVVPALDSVGFTLVGGRLDYVASRPVAAIVYGIRQHVINVYSWPEAGDDMPVSATVEQGYHMIHWRTGGITFWVASDLNSKELSRFVTLFRRE